MPSKPAKHPEAARSGEASLPEIETARAEFLRRQTRLWMSLLVRIVCLGVALAILTAQVPFLRQNRALLDALSGVLALWPFFTGIGRLHSWRISLGRRYIEAERWSEARDILLPLAGFQGRFFDATGEGRYWLASAYQALGEAGEAGRLFTEVAALPGGQWAEQARSIAKT